MALDSSNLSETSGCLVILEPDAEWPWRAFHRATDRDCVIVMTREPEEPVEVFVRRLGHRCELANRLTASIRTVILACSGDGQEAFQSRLELLRGIAAHLTRSHETRFAIVADRNTNHGSTNPLAMADALLEELRGQRVSVDVLSMAADPGKRARPSRARSQAEPTALREIA
jgi:hypothetical protein